jgi:hypothetical protein
MTIDGTFPPSNQINEVETLTGYLDEAFNFKNCAHYIIVTTPTFTLAQYDSSGNKTGPWVLPLLQVSQKGNFTVTSTYYQIEKPQGLSGTFLIIPPNIDERINYSAPPNDPTGNDSYWRRSPGTPMTITIRNIETSSFTSLDNVVQRICNRPSFAIVNLPAQPFYIDFSTNPHSQLEESYTYQNTFFGGVFQIAS